MTPIRLYLTVLLLLFAFQNTAWAQNFESLRPRCTASQLRSGLCFNADMDKAIETQQSKAFQDNFTQIINQAKSHLNRITPAPNKVVILDLDDTLINNAGYYRHQDELTEPTWLSWLKDHRPTTFYLDTLELAKSAKEKGFSLMFITGRPASQADETLSQVSEIPWDGAFFKPMGKSLSSAEFKTNVREMLQQLGYEIVLNIGDQQSDFDLPIKKEDGEYLLPNLLYTIP